MGIPWNDFVAAALGREPGHRYRRVDALWRAASWATLWGVFSFIASGCAAPEQPVVGDPVPATAALNGVAVSVPPGVHRVRFDFATAPGTAVDFVVTAAP